ncbi:hypothetical protein FJT64_027088 [Amphibalanus amphitrite]|uniref:DUF6729 domain-containing protein n=1 Tax=Amphibalanus amphitrite TaxID=1232801 RepID=A0A6A4W518_AMPAM|nr:hypothetical protein FJT64_027088 [Amphibalanus amphitrite]
MDSDHLPGFAEVDRLAAELVRTAPIDWLPNPKGWRETVAPADQGWLAQRLFEEPGKMRDGATLWHQPPQPPLAASGGAAHYFRRRLFLWMPRKMWNVDLRYPRCPYRRVCEMLVIII